MIHLKYGHGGLLEVHTDRRAEWRFLYDDTKRAVGLRTADGETWTLEEESLAHRGLRLLLLRDGRPQSRLFLSERGSAEEDGDQLESAGEGFVLASKGVRELFDAGVHPLLDSHETALVRRKVFSLSLTLAGPDPRTGRPQGAVLPLRVEGLRQEKRGRQCAEGRRGRQETQGAAEE